MKNLDQPAFSIFDSDANPLSVESLEYMGNNGKNVMAIGLTKHELACIELRLPQTGDADLDALIAKVQLRDLASSAMKGILSNPETSKTIDSVFKTYKSKDSSVELPDVYASSAVDFAKALIAEIEKESTNQ